MKKVILLFVLIIGFSSLIISCSRDGDSSGDYERECGTYNGKILYTGPKGGCYYKQSDGEKTYVERTYCKCLK